MVMLREYAATDEAEVGGGDPSSSGKETKAQSSKGEGVILGVRLLEKEGAEIQVCLVSFYVRR